MVLLILPRKDQVLILNSYHGISEFYVGDCSVQQLQDSFVRKGFVMFLNSNQGLAKVI